MSSSEARTRFAALASMVLAVVAAAPLIQADPAVPTATSAGDAAGGFELEVEAWWVAPQNADIDYAFFDDGGDLLSGGEVRTLSWDRSSVPTFRFGWQFAGSGAPSFGVRLWEFDEETSAATGNHPGEIGPLLMSPGFQIDSMDSAEGASRIRALAVDADIRWRLHTRDRLGLEISAGLRLFRYEQSVRVRYLRADGIRDTIVESADARGLGPVARAALSYDLSRRVSIRGGAGVAMAVGEIESRTNETCEACLSGQTVGAQILRPGSSRTFLQWSGDLGVEWALPGGWSVSASYAFQHWSGVASRDRFVDVLSTNTAVREERDVAFEGFLLGAKVRFY